MTQLVLFNKPYGVLSQFRADANNSYGTLVDYFYEKSHQNLRVAGRLDATSEGLLLLTDNGKVNAAITQPAKATHTPPKRQGLKLGKTYWVQVEGIATATQIQQLNQGVVLKDGLTLPALVHAIAAPNLWQRNPPVHFRQSVPTQWLSITLFEGKNRQIRRMTAAVGLPTLRLVRVQIGDFKLANLQPSQWVKVHLSTQRLAALGVV